MRLPFAGKYPISQGFNDVCCRASYAKFGLKGHNGIDYALPSGTQVLAPQSGVVIEAANDPTGYGLYIKIENSLEGSVLAHLQSFSVVVGQSVVEGQLVGISDNTGNSTGPHLHSGFYRFPRDRNNGFNGFIDQTPYLAAAATPPTPTPPPSAPGLTDQTKWKVGVSPLGTDFGTLELGSVRSKLFDNENKINLQAYTIKQLTEKLNKIKELANG